VVVYDNQQNPDEFGVWSNSGLPEGVVSFGQVFEFVTNPARPDHQ
jgi:hypothetical protein